MDAFVDEGGGVQLRDRVRQPVADRVRISAEQVQGGLLDAVDQLVGLLNTGAW